MKLSGIVFLYLFCSYSFTQEQYLVINPGGHRSTIYDAEQDNDGNIITASFDKTVKVWDVKKGFLKKEFLGQIGPGSEGMIYSVALSPDNKYLATGGWFGKDDESEDLGDIRIYDYQTGAMKKLLKFHANVIRSMAFSQDSKYLIAGDADGNIVLWNYLTDQIVLSYDHLAYDVSSIQSFGDYFISCHTDGMVYMWNFMKTKPIKKFPFFSKTGEAVTPEVAISEDGSRIVIFGQQLGAIVVLDGKLGFEEYFVTGDNEVVEIALSPSGNRIAAAIKDPGKNKVVVYEKTGEQWLSVGSYKSHDDIILTVQFLDENTLVSTGGTRIELAVWELNPGEKTKEKFVLRGTGNAFYSAALDSNQLAFSHVPDKAYGNAPYREVFDIFSRQLESDFSDFSKFNFPVQEKNGYKLYEKEFKRKTEWDPNEILYLTENNILLDSVLRYPWQGNRHDSYCFVKEKYFVSGGSYGTLEAFDFSGNLKSRFVGHDGDIRSITISANEKFLVSSGTDMTIRLWPMNEIGLGKNGNLPTFMEYSKQLGNDGKFLPLLRELNLLEKANTNSPDAWNEIIHALEKKGQYLDKFRYKLQDETVNTIYPAASIFIGENREWVIWNMDGYFTSSRKGANYVGYHINQGKNKAAKFYPFDQFDLKYNRPDIILKDLELADAETIELYEKAYNKRLKRMGLNESDLQNEIHAPELVIKKTTQNGAMATIHIVASDSKFDLDRINIFINDVPVAGRKGMDISTEPVKKYENNIELELMGGENKIQLSVLNSKGVESMRETVYLTNTEKEQGDLYIISVGVSQYKDKKYNLQYASKDAEDMLQAFAINSVYETVHQKLLVNEQVTKENLLEIKEFLKSSKRNDVVMIFIAGHGVLDKNMDYYYCTYDVDFQNPEQRGISYDELESILENIMALRKLLIMDTCHSGELDKDDLETVSKTETENTDVVFRTTESTTTVRERQGLQKTNEAVKEMFNDLNRGTGATVISSAGGVEYAMESAEWKNGLFTFCLLNGLKTKLADLNADGKIFISELQQYIRLAVLKISNGKQTPGSRFENISLDYQIW